MIKFSNYFYRILFFFRLKEKYIAIEGDYEGILEESNVIFFSRFFAFRIYQSVRPWIGRGSSELGIYYHSHSFKK